MASSPDREDRQVLIEQHGIRIAAKLEPAEALLEVEPGISTEPMCRLRRQNLESWSRRHSVRDVEERSPQSDPKPLEILKVKVLG